MSITPRRGRMFSTREAAEYLGMPLQRLRRLVAAKKIAVVRDGRLAFLERDLDAWLERHRTPARDERGPTLAMPSPDAPIGIDDLPREPFWTEKAS